MTTPEERSARALEDIAYNLSALEGHIGSLVDIAAVTRDILVLQTSDAFLEGLLKRVGALVDRAVAASSEPTLFVATTMEIGQPTARLLIEQAVERGYGKT